MLERQIFTFHNILSQTRGCVSVAHKKTTVKGAFVLWSLNIEKKGGGGREGGSTRANKWLLYWKVKRTSINWSTNNDEVFFLSMILDHHVLKRFHKPDSKRYRPESWTVRWCPHWEGRIHLRGKKYSRMCLKLDWSLQTPTHWLVWYPGCQRLF